MMVKDGTVESLVEMLHTNLVLSRGQAEELAASEDAIRALKQDLAAREQELRMLREARAQERAGDGRADALAALQEECHHKEQGRVRAIAARDQAQRRRDEVVAQAQDLQRQVKALTEDRNDWRVRGQKAIADHSTVQADLQKARDEVRVKTATIAELEVRLRKARNAGYDDLDGPDRKEVQDG